MVTATELETEPEEYQYLREQLVRRMKVLPKNHTELLAVLSIIHKSPGLSSNDIYLLTEGIPESTFYRYLKSLRDNKVITKNNRISFPVNHKNFLLPNSIRQGVMPNGAEAPYTHLAAYLNKFSSNDIVPPYGMSRADILEKVKRQIEQNPDRAHRLVTGITEGLAVYAMMQGNIDAFNNMLGRLDPPKDLESL